jgi:hypothetical protein
MLIKTIHYHFFCHITIACDIERMMVTSCTNMFFYQAVCFVIFISSFIVLVEAEKHLNTNGAFRKRHTVHNEPSPYACNRGAGITSPFIRQRTRVPQDLQVSKTVYQSNEQIQVTWTPIKASCKDDFIGIYYVEIPLDTGKQIILS